MSVQRYLNALKITFTDRRTVQHSVSFESGLEVRGITLLLTDT